MMVDPFVIAPSVDVGSRWVPLIPLDGFGRVVLVVLGAVVVAAVVPTVIVGAWLVLLRLRCHRADRRKRVER
jgi:hypothetical protein